VPERPVVPELPVVPVGPVDPLIGAGFFGLLCFLHRIGLCRLCDLCFAVVHREECDFECDFECAFGCDLGCDLGRAAKLLSVPHSTSPAMSAQANATRILFPGDCGRGCCRVARVSMGLVPADGAAGDSRWGPLRRAAGSSPL
jgi:hypothetical protein